jgi:hypothetical protein
MNQQVTREILWNVPVAFRIFLYAMLIPLTAAFVYEGKSLLASKTATACKMRASAFRRRFVCDVIGPYFAHLH